MDRESIDPRWSKLLSLAVHEFRTPITVVAGYIRMLLKERAGAITDQQRKLLEEAEKGCGRLSGLVAEMSDLSALEGGTAGFNAGALDLRAVLSDAIAALPDLPDREVRVELQAAAPAIPVHGDAARLRTAMTSLLLALRRELVTSDRLLVRITSSNGAVPPVSTVAIGDGDQIDTNASAEPSALDRFDEWRGGSGLSLAIARRIIGQHGGSLYGPPGGGKAGAVVILPRP